MKHRTRALDLLFAAHLAVSLIGVAACSTQAPAPAPSPAPSPAPGQKSVVIDLVAHNITFNMSQISVPAGAAVTVNLDNQDTGIPHNFAVYQNLPGGQTNPVFVGSVVNGPGKTTYRFTAPSAAGDYFFECDVHPQVMNGKFIVTVP